MTYTLDLADPMAARPESAGGKGANLAILAARGFRVPSGFVVVPAAYREFLASGPSLAGDVAALPFGDPAALRDAATRLRGSLARCTLPAELTAEVRERLARLPPGLAVAVRSSSTFEDLAGAAFAGQHETFLNCVGADSVLRRIADCYLSLWLDRALAYRQQQGLDHLEAAMAVVVQEMVPSEVSGVAFSVNPVSGRLDEIVVEANFGLGESVVSGEAAVDTFVVRGSDGAVLESRVAEKTIQVVGTAEGTAEVAVDAGDACRPALEASQLRDLAAVVKDVERAYRFPQDVEWALAGGVLHLLQARPVTSIPPRWTRDESAERFPNPITPLTWDFVEGGFHRSLAHSFRLMGFPPCPSKWFALFHSHVYGNQNAVQVYGRYLSTPLASLDDVRRLVPTLRASFAWVQELPVAWSRNLDWYLLRLGVLGAEPLEARSDAEVWRHVLEVNAHGADYFLPNIAISIAQGGLHRLLFGLVTLVVGPAEAPALFDRLTCWCQTKTAVVNAELVEIAGLARADAALGRLLLGDAASREVWHSGELRAHAAFSDRLSRFLRDHGHREVDFDAYTPTWGEQPWVVLDSVRLLLRAAPDVAPREHERSLKLRQQEAELELHARVPADLRFFYAEILRLARAYTALDDLEHYQTTRLTPPLRRALRELGRRLVAKGVIAEEMDVFFARQHQVSDALGRAGMAAWAELRESIARQKTAYLADAAAPVAWELDAAGTGTPAAAPPEGERTLRGIPGSPGTAEGACFRVLTPDDFGRFPKGAVLVARTTNPTWTPLFHGAAAVVTESGGALSHGAVTAREMRIPAVMSVRGCLARLHDGVRVRVDGTSGRVELL